MSSGRLWCASVALLPAGAGSARVIEARLGFFFRYGSLVLFAVKAAVLMFGLSFLYRFLVSCYIWSGVPTGPSHFSEPLGAGCKQRLQNYLVDTVLTYGMYSVAMKRCRSTQSSWESFSFGVLVLV